MYLMTLAIYTLPSYIRHQYVRYQSPAISGKIAVVIATAASHAK